MNGIFDTVTNFISDSWGKLTESAESLAEKAKYQAESKAAQTVAIATGKLVPLVGSTVTKAVTTVGKPVVNVFGKVIGGIFSEPPKPQAAVVPMEQTEVIYEDGTQVPSSGTVLTTFPGLNTVPLEHPMANILPKGK